MKWSSEMTKAWKYGAMVSLLCTLTACSAKEAAKDHSAALQPVDLSLSLYGYEQAKASSSIIGELGTQGKFGGMEQVRLLPFSGTPEAGISQRSAGPACEMPSITSASDEAAFSGYTYHQGLIRNNHSHFYSNAVAQIPLGTTAILMYGRSPRKNMATVQEENHANGALAESGWNYDPESTMPASDIRFSPVPIHTGGIPPLATTLTNLLTSIAQGVSFTRNYYYKRNEVWHEAYISIVWDENLSDPTLREWYRWFTGDGALMTGAGSNVEYMLSTLYGRLTRYNNDEEEYYTHMAGGVEYPAYLSPGATERLSYAMLYNGLRDELLSRFTYLASLGYLDLGSDSVTFRDSRLRAYPVSTGLPSGSAVLRWNGIRYGVVTEGMDGIAALDRFCYMPSLYYFANSSISTSANANIYKRYTSEAESWQQLLNLYRQGKEVTISTRAVALDQPLQFGCGMMSATVRSSASLLGDNDGDPRTNCSVTGTNFPVTGVIIGGQHSQFYNFTADSESEEYYLYDNQISGIYLTTAESAEFRTLVLPTLPGEDVYFFLELRNDSGATFTGAEGLILPGNYFYLAGKLEKSEDPAYPSIFMSDRSTRASFIIPSFENAHIAIPDMGHPQLVMGVQSSLNWTMAASSYVVLD